MEIPPAHREDPHQFDDDLLKRWIELAREISLVKGIAQEAREDLQGLMEMRSIILRRLEEERRAENREAVAILFQELEDNIHQQRVAAKILRKELLRESGMEKALRLLDRFMQALWGEWWQ
jgi:hypothetical protein